MGVQAQQQLLGLEGLHQVVVGPGLEADGLIDDVAFGREHEPRGAVRLRHLVVLRGTAHRLRNRASLMVGDTPALGVGDVLLSIFDAFPFQGW